MPAKYLGRDLVVSGTAPRGSLPDASGYFRTFPENMALIKRRLVSLGRVLSQLLKRVLDHRMWPSRTDNLVRSIQFHLACWRAESLRRPWVVLGGSVRYRREDVRTFEAAHRRDP